MKIRRQRTASQDFCKRPPCWLADGRGPPASVPPVWPPGGQHRRPECSAAARKSPATRDYQPQSTYIRRVQSCVWRLPKYWPPPHPPSPPSECVLPPVPKAGGTHSPGGEGHGGSIFWKTPGIGLASYNNLSSLYVISSCSLALSRGGIFSPLCRCI